METSMHPLDMLTPTLLAIPGGEVRAPRMPPETAGEEAEAVYALACEDRAELQKSRLDWDLVESLPLRAKALYEAEARWKGTRLERGRARREWKERSPQGGRCRSELLRWCRFAYRSDRELCAQVTAISARRRVTDMPQALLDLIALCRAQPGPLVALGFDLERLDRLSSLAAELARLLAAARATRAWTEAKGLRDRAYIYVCMALREVRTCAEFVFHRDHSRLGLYASRYRREHRGGRKRLRGAPEPGGSYIPGGRRQPAAGGE